MKFASRILALVAYVSAAPIRVPGGHIVDSGCILEVENGMAVGTQDVAKLEKCSAERIEVSRYAFKVAQ